ncbi:hypothetical protein Tco_0894003 [Tanacetum coccineum]|uniref:Uncharacterized protein n=1 Tax=Tanacetum coccineum TaxID=301880 RepID=A0ABQ5CAG5_9ASTR
MSFGLKNTGATYHKLVDKVFASQIRRNKKVYAENIVIKSMDEEDMLLETNEGEKEEEFQDVEEKDEKMRSSKWKLYTDRASNDDGFGDGLMLVNPEGVEFTYALKFEFKALKMRQNIKP